MKYEITNLKNINTKDKIITITFRKKQYYLASEELWKIIQKIQNKKRFPYFAGLYLGYSVKGKYYPSLSANEFLKMNKVVIKEKAVMRFTYGKDIPNYYIIKKTGKLNEIVKVVNAKDEFLGYGFLKEDGIKNIIDIGDYLRRE